MSKLDPLAILEGLITDGKVEVEDGVFLLSEQKIIKPIIFNKDGLVIIEFDAPFVYLHVEKLGPKKLVNLVKPKVDHILIKKESIEVKMSTLGVWEFPR